MTTTSEEVLSAEDVRRQVPMRRAIDAVREVLLEVAAGSFVLPPRLVVGDGRILVMTAFHQPTGTAAVKALEVRLDRMPAIIGTVTWMGTNGRMIADASAITTLRTGAIAGVATDALAPRDASVMTLFGAGAQAPDQIRAVHTVRPLTALTVFDRDRPRAEKLLSELEGELPGVHLRSADDVTTALTDVEIVSCATSSSTPLFPADALPVRVHVNAIGSFRPTMRELPDELLATADLVVVEQIEAATDEAGEIIHALETGTLTRHRIHEPAEILETAPETTGRTVFKTVGIAAQDWAVARLLSKT
ncbi:ornithine cyclodeaminase family protein [Embleya sp. NPDC055664]